MGYIDIGPLERVGGFVIEGTTRSDFAEGNTITPNFISSKKHRLVAWISAKAS